MTAIGRKPDVSSPCEPPGRVDCGSSRFSRRVMPWLESGHPLPEATTLDELIE
jgi:hypothetical protein